MSNATENNNVFSRALDARHAECVKLDKMSDKNRATLLSFRDELNQRENIVAFLTHAQVDVRVLQNDIYEIEKMRNIARFLCDEITLRDFNEMTRCVFLTALAFAKESIAFTRQDATHACSAHYKINDKKRRDLTVQNKKNVADSTVASQHRSSLLALLDLNIVKQINKHEFRVDLDNENTKKLAEKLA